MAGVTLFHLARLRANKRFFSMLEPAQVLKQPHSSEEHIELSRFLASSRSMAFCFRLETRSLPSSSLPQKHFSYWQDWWTLLSWHLPSLFHILPCKFNLQSSVQYLHPPWEKTFSEYHSCNKTSAVVVHRKSTHLLFNWPKVLQKSSTVTQFYISQNQTKIDIFLEKFQEAFEPPPLPPFGSFSYSYS